MQRLKGEQKEEDNIKAHNTAANRCMCNVEEKVPQEEKRTIGDRSVMSLFIKGVANRNSELIHRTAAADEIWIERVK